MPVALRAARDVPSRSAARAIWDRRDAAVASLVLALLLAIYVATMNRALAGRYDPRLPERTPGVAVTRLVLSAREPDRYSR